MHRIVRSVREQGLSYKWSSLAGGLGALAIMGTAAVAALSGAPQQPAGRSADNIGQVTNQRPDGAVARDNITGQVAIVQFNKARLTRKSHLSNLLSSRKPRRRTI